MANLKNGFLLKTKLNLITNLRKNIKVMSKVKELKKQHDFLNVTILDLIKILDPSGKSKYVDLFVRSIKHDYGTYSTKNAYNEIQIESGIDLQKIICDHDNITQKIWLDVMCNVIKFDDIKTLHKFHELNERQLIPDNDISKYKKISDLTNVINLAELKMQDASMDTHVVVLNNDEQWLVLRPLTHLASVKYGYGTKWCTAMKHDHDYFRRYSRRGVLIYCLNKEIGDKVAFFHNIDTDYDRETSFWNIKDERIDSMESGLPPYILNIIKEQMASKITNVKLRTAEIAELEENYYRQYEESKISGELPLIAEEVAEPRLNPVDAARQHLEQAISEWANQPNQTNTDEDVIAEI